MENKNNSIETNICEAVEILVQRAVATVSYDRTIQGTIQECVDQTIGKYVVSYQDSTFYAYSGNSDTSYSDGSVVYVLIPGNDFSRDKTILGTTKKLGINYIPTIDDEDAYQIIGNNCIISSGSFGLQSYRKNKQVIVLYSKDRSDSQNLIKLNNTSIQEYIKNQKSIICGMTVRTELPPEQQFQGNYGILFTLRFMDNTNSEIITRYYTIDVDKMRGNPYKMLYDTRQIGIFDIDGENFIDIESISLFCYNFPNNKPDNEYIDDIFIKNIELYGAERLEQSEIDSYTLTFLTPQGIYFDGTSLMSDIRTIEAQVRIKGKLIDNSSQQLPFYWFIEHSGITSESKYYNKYGGQGWKCLNEYNVIEQVEDSDREVVEWIPSTYRFVVTKADILAKEVKYKCVVVYDGVVISRTIIIKNLASAYDITITSDSGTKFYFDTGFPTLTCFVNGVSNTSLNYSWGVTNNVGTFETISETQDLNAQYITAYNNYNTLVNQIKNEQRLPEASKSLLASAESDLKRFDKITRVEKNKIYKLNVNTITSFNTYSCTVYQGEAYLGTASIILTNKLELEGVYTLVINDGSAVYKYNEDGISPASNAVDNPIDIKALSFNIYNNLGQKIEDSIVMANANINWVVPNKNRTLLTFPYTTGMIDNPDGTVSYKSKFTLEYSIADRYDSTKTDNEIKLFVDYKGMHLSANTSLVFTKEGDIGTNGTEFYCNIVPNVPSGMSSPRYPLVTQKSDGSWELNYQTKNSNVFFRAQLWHNSEKIFDNPVSGNSTEGKAVTVEWSMLQNKYSSASYQDPSSFSVDAKTGVFNFNGYNSTHPGNIVKTHIRYDGMDYYATLSILTVKVNNNDYRLLLKEGTGFLSAVYSSDGTRPKYDNAIPFTITVNRKISNIYEDVSLMTSSSYAVGFSWNYLGRIYRTAWISDSHVQDLRVTATVEKNQKAAKPTDEYDGECVTNAIECIVTKTGGGEIGRIHIPINLILNRYGNKAINGWDGNSVSIDNDGGVILTPQAGAGIKESDNSFTGVVIGKVRESWQTSDDVGLIGYSHGVRSIFLDARTGKSIFGIKGQGQIVIDPTNNQAEIYSGNYVYKPDGTGTGMKINLSEPSIKFGSGNFEVSKEGYLTAKGGGKIGGWNLTDTEFYASDGSYNQRKITLDAGGKKLYSTTKTTPDSTKDGFYLDENTFILGSKFKASTDGSLNIGTGAVNGTGKHWTIDGNAFNSYIKYGTRYSTGSIYMGTDGISIGKCFDIDASGTTVTIKYNTDFLNPPWGYGDNEYYLGTDGLRIGSKFKVENNGTLQLGDLNGKYWTIDGNSANAYIAFGGTIFEPATLPPPYGDTANPDDTTDNDQNDTSISDTAEVYLGTDGISLGKRFSVSANGEVRIYNANIGNWIISDTMIESTTNGKYGMAICANGSMRSVGFTYSNQRGDGQKWRLAKTGRAWFNETHIRGSLWIEDNISLYVGTKIYCPNGGHQFCIDYTGEMTSTNWLILKTGDCVFKSITSRREIVADGKVFSENKEVATKDDLDDIWDAIAALGG